LLAPGTRKAPASLCGSRNRELQGGSAQDAEYPSIDVAVQQPLFPRPWQLSGIWRGLSMKSLIMRKRISFLL